MQIPYAGLPFRSLMKTSRPGPRTSLPHVELAGGRAALVASDEDNVAVLHARQACVAVLASAWASVREIVTRPAALVCAPTVSWNAAWSART